MSWVLDTAAGPVVGKLILEPTASVAARLDEHRRVGEAGAAVPRILAYSSGTAALGPDLVVVSEFIDGVDAEAALPSLRPEIATGVVRDAGRAVAALHSTAAPHFGGPGPTATHDERSSWAGYVSGRAADLAASHGRVPTPSQDVLAAGRALVVDLAKEVSGVVEPVPAHGDVYPPNLLLDVEGRFVALLDLEHVRWVDPVMDFVKPAMWMFADRADWAALYKHGYQARRGLPPLWAERLSVCMGLELLTGVGYWHRVGASAMAQDYSSRLRRWVDSHGVVTGWPGRFR
jgi:aminoglycoside phosphotransferase (APT) family kinase protein